jgi:hypothetical protein
MFAGPRHYYCGPLQVLDFIGVFTALNDKQIEVFAPPGQREQQQSQEGHTKDVHNLLLGENVCDVLASRMASATPAQHLHCLYGCRAQRPCSMSRSAGWRAKTAMAITSREHGRPKTSTGEHGAVTGKQL